jgi:hypothetical protein
MGVQIIRGLPDSHRDPRRVIMDAEFSEGFSLPYAIKQVKTIVFTAEAAEKGMVIGNHYHPEQSGRQEFFILIGELSVEEKKIPQPAAIFRCRAKGGAIKQTILNVGDCCVVPVDWSHSFKPLRVGVSLIGITNKGYSDDDSVKDVLF